MDNRRTYFDPYAWRHFPEVLAFEERRHPIGHKRAILLPIGHGDGRAGWNSSRHRAVQPGLRVLSRRFRNAYAGGYYTDSDYARNSLHRLFNLLTTNSIPDRVRVAYSSSAVQLASLFPSLNGLNPKRLSARKSFNYQAVRSRCKTTSPPR